MKLVPLEPTAEMLVAGNAADYAATTHKPAAAIYRAMLAAAPKPDVDAAETPRTDANAFVVSSRNELRVVEGLGEVVAADFARQLERELAQARAALEEQRRQMDYPDLPPAFALTMKRMLDEAIRAAGKVNP